LADALHRLILGLGLSVWVLPVCAAGLIVEHAWIRATAPSQPVAGAYMKLTSDTDAALVGASSPMADKAEIHVMKMRNGIMSMRPVESLALPRKQTIELKPGGYHIMLMGLKQPFKPGDRVPISLIIRVHNKPRQVQVEAEVRGLVAPDAEQPH
jgi:copper(I)-binding protein